MIGRLHTYNSNLYTIKLIIKKANTAIMIRMKPLDDTLKQTFNKNSHPRQKMSWKKLKKKNHEIW